MGYRGEDLDLRTPRVGGGLHDEVPGPPAANGWRARSGLGTSRSLPIWVDAMVLACCNHAYEIAVAHRAAEVRPEHLLYALLRIDTAVSWVEARGLRASALRRDCAEAIANDAPAGPAAGTVAPRRSEEFEDVLRRAAALAYRNNAPAGVGHVLDVLLDRRGEISGAQLLAWRSPRHRRESTEELPPPGRFASVHEAPLTLERPGEPVGPARLETLDEVVRGLSAEIAGERKLVSGGMEELQREIFAQREDVSRLARAMQDKLQVLEQLVATPRPTGLGPELIGRLQALEKLLQSRAAAPPPDLGPLEARLAAVEKAVAEGAARGARSWDEAAQKIAGLASGLATLPQAAPEIASITGRLEIIEEAVLSAAGEDASHLSDRLRAVEEAVAAQRAQAMEATAAVVADIKAVAGALANQQALAERAQAGVHERVQSLATVLERQRGALDAGLAQPLLGRIDTLAGRLREAGGELARRVEALGGRLATIEGAVTERTGGYVKELGELHEAIVRLNGNQHTLGGTLEASRQESAGVREAMTTVAVRLEGLEREAGRSMFVLEALASRLEGMYRATVDRDHRRNRFWYWLFGTDDWVAASWPSQAARIEAERRAAIGTVRK
jgi:ClpA/ClpB-like protein